MIQHHALQRAAERYGYDLTEGEQRHLCVKLCFQDVSPTQDCYLVGKQPDGRERWIVWHKAEWMALVYSPSAGRIVTFLPPEAIRNHRRRLPW